ncbi:hypothetical protein [Phenylobacterium sp.]|uniref:hypothetical protein n=1 Tax=Phenylobacterium sp. TaxID=1871053 RepID=UPI002733CD2A|nr:hypothetical protein [Phenylobacterium sp.]MDP3852572.1 hypothetical protein [Phenylobacterium sp.]
MKAALIVFAAASLAATSVPAQPTAPPAPGASRDCFRMSQLRGHKRVDAKTLHIEAGNRAVYRWEMSGSCLAGASSNDPLVMSPAGGSDLICRPIDLDLKVMSGVMLSPCIIKSFTRLTPAEVAALPPRLKP